MLKGVFLSAASCLQLDWYVICKTVKTTGQIYKHLQYVGQSAAFTMQLSILICFVLRAVFTDWHELLAATRKNYCSQNGLML